MFEQTKKLGLSFVVTVLIACIGLGMDPTKTSHANPTPAEISARITALTGLQPEEIDAMYAAEQRPGVLLIAYDIAIPIVFEPRIGYLLVRVAATQQWIRVQVDQTEWNNDFRPYIEEQGVTILEQPHGTIDSLTPAQEAAAIAAGGATPGTAVANLILYGKLTNIFQPALDGDFPDAAIANPLVPASDNNPSVGAVQGRGGVSGGQAGYSIPIVVPPGRKGMQPSVSLSYSSSSGDGVAGVGWSLNAASAISRCAATAAQDGFTASVQYDASRDRLCLDGMRLMVVSGSYGASGAEYRTELDRFARIKQFGALNGTTTYFTVQHKNNTTSRYGLSSNSRHVAGSRTETLTWAITDTQDRSGNTITYDYFSFGNGEYHLDSIHYTGINGGDGDRHVRFQYETRPDLRSRFMAGGKTRSTKRLKKISTEYLSTVVREYTLGYGGQSLSTGRSLLRSIEECAYQNAVAYCLPKTEFTWQEQAPQYVTEQLQFTDAGTPTNVHADKRWLHEVLPHGDVNGDGVKDWTDWYVNAEGEKTGDHANTLANCYRPVGSFYYTCLEADFDADGLTDSFRKNNDKFEIRFADSGVWINTGLDWIEQVNADMSDRPLGFADFNGDGWVDLAFVQSARLWVYFHTRNLASPYSNGSRQLVMTFSVANYRLTNTAQIYGDMDGSGTPDFVVSRFATSNEPQGTPRPQYIILTKSQPGGSMTTATRQITGLLGSMRVNSHFFHDVNGDGMPDLLGLDPNNNNKVAYRLNTGVDFEAGWTDLGFGLPTRGGRYFHGPNEWEFYRYPIMSKIFAMDYNGDGRDELMIADAVVASGCSLVVSVRPNGTRINEWLCDDDLYGEYRASSISNVGTPINGNVKDNSVRRYSAISFSDDAAGNIVATTSTSDIIASASQTAVIDATGDGLPDVVTVFGCRLPEPDGCRFNDQTASHGGVVDPAYQQEGAWINRNIGAATGGRRYDGYDLMSAVQDGFGNRHEWIYRPLSSDEYDTANSDFYQTTHSYQANDGDYFHFASSMYVVAEHKGSNGVGGLNNMLYRYRGAIYNNKGRGFQGFRSIIAEQDVYAAGHALAGTDKIGRTDFHQKWPLSSQIEQACTWLVADNSADDNPNCSSVISSTTVDSIHSVATSGGARFVTVDQQTTRSFDLATRSLLTTQVVDRSFDAAGNVTYESLSHTDGWTSNLTETTSVYALDWSGWWLNKLSSSSVKYNPVSQRHASSPAIASGTDTMKQVTTSFTQYDSTHRLPTTVTISANDTSLSSTVTTGYNAYGLPSSIQTTGTNVTGPRTVATTYSKNGATQAADGYFPFTVTNTLGHQTEQRTDPAYGQPTSQWDVNDLLTTTNYDAFGRVSAVTLPGEPTASQRYFWCGVATSCPFGAIFIVNTYRAGAPETQSYLDSLGREIQSSVRNFADTSFINVSTSFDERGNTTFTSQPYDLAVGESAAIGTRFLSYDALDRLKSKEIDQANGAVFLTSYTYGGLKTSINAGGLLMHRVYNGLEQLVETKDAMGGFTRYAYDGAGNPIVMQDPNGHSTTAKFNALGHKQWVSDPNMGQKSFAYTALGEVLSELDANGDTVSMYYDVLGRLAERRVNGSLVGSWHYDNGAADKGLGLLDYEDSHPGSDGSGLQKHYYYGTAGSGRKDLTRVTHRFYENSNPNDATDYHTDYYTDSYYARPKGIRYPGGIGINFVYNGGGYLTKEKDASSGYILRRVTARDSRNEVIASAVAHGHLNQTAEYYDASGQMKSIVVNGLGGDVHNLYYEYDSFGNLDYQRAIVNGVTSTERFIYDNLHRLKRSDRALASGSSTVTYGYDPAGNLTAKSDYATSYNYNLSRPNAVASVTKAGGGTASFDYDANGNLISGDGRTLTYNAFNKPTSITASGVTASFYYGADLARYKQAKNNGETILYIDKRMEIVTTGGTTNYRHYLSDVAILTKTGDLNDTDPDIRFLHRDRLGSLATITDEGGQDVQARGFDPFGKPRDGDWADRSPPTLGSAITDRGFTEHEHLDESQLIHMNGRVYDYNLGRFLSVDPFIQEPGNSQSLNPYSYIMNNPLAGTDPTGYQATTCADDGKSCTRAYNVKPDPRSLNRFSTRVTETLTENDDGSYTLNRKFDNGSSFTQTFNPASNGTGSSSPDQIGSPAGGQPSIFDRVVDATPQVMAGAVPGGDAAFELVVHRDMTAAAKSAGLEVSMAAGGAIIGAWFGGIGAAPGAAAGYLSAKAVRFGRATMRLLRRSDGKVDVPDVGPKLGDLSIAKVQRGAVGSRRAPEFSGGRVSESGFLDAAEDYLGPGYQSLPNGRYVSADGLRQVRYGKHETSSKLHHGHFEAYDKPGGRVIENTMVEIHP